MSDLYWDDGEFWDDGADWDILSSPGGGNIQPYINLITSEHIDKPNFIASISTILQPIADNAYTLSIMNGSFDLDVAVGNQLDIIGQWVGISRVVNVLTNVYFSFDTIGLGFDEGTWFGPNDYTTGLTSLPDENYRTLLRAKIALNHWDGTIPGAYSIYAILFANEGYNIIIQDNGNMTMYFGIVNGNPDAVTIALLVGGYISTKPAGVEIAAYYINSIPNTMIFGFDSIGPSIGGFDEASWATALA